MYRSDIVQDDEDPWAQLFVAHWRRNEVAVRRAVGEGMLPAQSLRQTAKKRARAGRGNIGCNAEKLADSPSQRPRIASVPSTSTIDGATAVVGAAAPVRTATAPAPAPAAPASEAPAQRSFSPPSSVEREKSSSPLGIHSVKAVGARPSREPDLTDAVIDAVMLRRSSLLHWCQRNDFSCLVTGALVRIADPTDGNRGYYTGLVTGAFEFRQPYVVHGSRSFTTKQGLLIQRADGHTHTVRLHGMTSAHNSSVCNQLKCDVWPISCA